MSYTAHADGDETATLSIVRVPGAESCPGLASIRAEVARRVGREVSSLTGSLAVELVFAPEGDASARIVHARVFLRAPDRSFVGERELTAPVEPCRDLAHAIDERITLTGKEADREAAIEILDVAAAWEEPTRPMLDVTQEFRRLVGDEMTLPVPSIEYLL